MLDKAQANMTEAENQRYQTITEAVSRLHSAASRVYQLLTNNRGDLSLSISNSRILAFREGILLSIRPPSESSAWTDYSRLSGGQQSLASLALILGFHVAYPSPLLLMDEIEGALDASYAQRVSNFLLSGLSLLQANPSLPKPQIIIVSLRRSMYAMSPFVVGCFQHRGCTHTISVAFHEAEHTTVADGEVH